MPATSGRSGDAPIAHTPAEPASCTIDGFLRFLGRAHMLELTYLFMRENPGPLRFREVRERLDAPANTLSERLRELVEEGLLTRTVHDEQPPRVEYAATARLLALRPAFDAVSDWVAAPAVTGE